VSTQNDTPFAHDAALEIILGFSHLLRIAGLRVGLTETEDAVRAMQLAHNLSSWRASLKATLIKRRRDEAVFDHVFDLYFGSWIELNGESDHPIESSFEALEKLMESRSGTPAEVEEQDQRYQDEMDRAIQFINRFVFNPTRNDNASNLQTAMMLMSQMISKRSGTAKSNEEIQLDLERAFIESHDDEDSINAIESLLEDGDFGESDFGSMDDVEAQLIEAQIEKLIELLSIQLRRRLQRKLRGTIDLRRTIRRSIQYGGTPIRLAHKRRRKEKPKIYILVDISSSVERYARFFLMLTRAFVSTPINCRSFAFEDRALEITARLEREMSRFPRAGQAVERVLSRLRLQGWGMRRSSYGTSLEQFVREIGCEVDRHATIVILGDARNNYAPPRANILESLQRKAERVIWLNPEPKGLWDGGDSVMSSYAPYCDHLHECRKLEQLRAIIHQIVKLGDKV